ncbi:MAG TPA: nucleotidyltransferase family protein [Chloroflexota bacterium]|nr:nucleotidyltransferase family protein [Chloroflexota bacterium]
MSGNGRRNAVQEAPPPASKGSLAHLASHLDVDQAALSQFCRRHHIRRLALFGSVLRDDFGPESDIDVLVEFEPEHIPGLAFFAMQDELSELLQRPVDLNTLEWLSPYFREAVAREAVVLYDAT